MLGTDYGSTNGLCVPFFITVTFTLLTSIMSRRNARGRVFFQDRVIWEPGGSVSCNVRAFNLAGRRVCLVNICFLCRMTSVLSFRATCNGNFIFLIRHVRCRITCSLLRFMCVIRRGSCFAQGLSFSDRGIH